MNNRSDKLFKVMQLLGDLVLLNICFAIAGWLRFDDLRVENQEYYNYYVQLAIFFNLSWSFIAVATGIYSLRPGTEIRTSIGRSIRGLFIHAVLFSVLAFSLKGDYYSRLFLVYFYSFFSVGVLILRTVFISFWRKRLARGKYSRTIWLVGDPAIYNRFKDEIDLHPEYGYRYLGSPETLDEGRNRIEIGERPDEVYVAYHSGDEKINDWFVLAEKQGIRFRYLPDFRWSSIRHAEIEQIGDTPVFVPRREPLSRLHSRWIKRLFDIVVSLIVIVGVLSWLMPVLMLVILVDSKGNPIFGQLRSGIDGAEFRCWKLRTMKVGLEDGGVQAHENDVRITRVGKWLRKYSLDELPQFFNVLWGTMSVVGPRPHMLAHTESYRHRVDTFMVRHWVKPGITGMAQVMGLRGETKEDKDMEDRVRADVYYLEHWSILLDIKIFLWTTANMLVGKNTGV